MPPALFVMNSTDFLSAEGFILSLFLRPVDDATSNPAPNSIPLTAPILIIAWERTASALSKTGSPSPAGIPVTEHAITPPAVFF